MKIAVVGTGIAGLTCAYLLSRRHDVAVFEAGAAVGGHTATVDVDVGGQRYAIDTGFIAYNDWTYPNFVRLLAELGVTGQPTTMGLSVKDRNGTFEYGSAGANTLFAQRGNLLNPKFWRMLADVLRFNREAGADLLAGRLDDGATLGQYLWRSNYGEYFVHRYLVPLGTSIWSSSIESMLDMPLQFFVRFFKQHGLLSLDHHPQWFVVQGGSRSYLAPLVAPVQQRIHVSTPVQSVRRDADGATVVTERFGAQHFDHVVLATHSDQALALLADADATERALLGALPYRMKKVVLHTDTRLLPRRRRTWSSWNYQLAARRSEDAVLTYNMSRLQGLDAPQTFCVTLNDQGSIDGDKVLRRFGYAHPVFTMAGVAAQQRWHEINGHRRTWFCGAYWRYGFHEDAVASALRVCDALGVPW